MQWCLEAPEKKKNILWGFLGTGISVAGVLVWCAFNFFNCAELDDGALIIRLEEGNKPKPPVILIKSDGGFGYQITDI